MGEPRVLWAFSESLFEAQTYRHKRYRTISRNKDARDSSQIYLLHDTIIFLYPQVE